MGHSGYLRRFDELTSVKTNPRIPGYWGEWLKFQAVKSPPRVLLFAKPSSSTAHHVLQWGQKEKHVRKVNADSHVSENIAQGCHAMKRL